MPDLLDTSRMPHPARSVARLGAVQALYQMEMAGTSLHDVLEEFSLYRLGQKVEGEQYWPADEAHFRDVVSGVISGQDDIDRQISQALAEGWTLTRIDSTLRALLRAGTCELRSCAAIPAKVVIAEYMDVARAFFEHNESGVANAVLDRIAREVRPGELVAVSAGQPAAPSSGQPE